MKASHEKPSPYPLPGGNFPGILPNFVGKGRLNPEPAPVFQKTVVLFPVVSQNFVVWAAKRPVEGTGPLFSSPNPLHGGAVLPVLRNAEHRRFCPPARQRSGAKRNKTRRVAEGHYAAFPIDGWTRPRPNGSKRPNALAVASQAKGRGRRPGGMMHPGLSPPPHSWRIATGAASLTPSEPITLPPHEPRSYMSPKGRSRGAALNLRSECETRRF